MRPAALLAGFEDGLRGERLARRMVQAACLLYALGFFAFYPTGATNDDESMYLRQTALALEGASSVPKIDPFTGQVQQHNPSNYPYGTALSMMLPVALFGERGAYLVPCVSLLAGTLLLSRWLAQAGRSPLFALLALGFPPSLVMGRVAMSDVPSFFAVTLGLWLFWRGIGASWRWWLASGFVAGASLLFRESNPIPFAPFFAGALLRRERNVWALVVGGLAGVSLRLIANTVFLETPLHYRSGYFLALDSLPERVPMYALALLVFVPGGLLLALLYRGERWLELRIAVAGFVVAYLIQKNYTFATSLLKNMVVTPRYVIPIVPLLVFGMAEAAPRLWRRLCAARPAAQAARLRAAAGWGLAVWMAGVALAAFAVHPAFARWAATQAEIRKAIDATLDPEAVVVSNFMATRKFLPELALAYVPVDSAEIDPQRANGLLERWGEVYLVFLDRSDSLYWREQIDDNARFVAAMRPEPELLLDERFTATDRLRIWRVRRRGGNPPG
jgi:4-amino-4-deoxy-L-arabinose transferase-like glycosyltransferase